MSPSGSAAMFDREGLVEPQRRVDPEPEPRADQHREHRDAGPRSAGDRLRTRGTAGWQRPGTDGTT